MKQCADCDNFGNKTLAGYELCEACRSLPAQDKPRFKLSAEARDRQKWEDRTPGAVLRVDDLAGSKPTNPKDAIGCNKVPMHLWPETATVLGAMALLEGCLKYGRANWREAGVRASIYFDACRRHMNAWFEGEDLDPDSGLPHLGHALACVAILVDSQAKGNLVYDRMFPGGYRKLIDEMTPEVKRLREKYADRSPKHWTIKDVEKKP